MDAILSFVIRNLATLALTLVMGIATGYLKSLVATLKQIEPYMIKTDLCFEHLSKDKPEIADAYAALLKAQSKAKGVS